MENTSFATTDEVSLVDLWKIIHHRKKTLYIVFILTIILAIAVVFLTPSTYESKAVVAIGKVNNQLVEEPNVLLQRLIQEYEVGDNSVHEKIPPYVESVSVDKKGVDTVLKITARARSAEGARSYLDRVVKKLLSEHEALYNNAVNLERTRLSSIKQQIGQVDEQIDRVNKLTTKLKDRDPTQAAVLAIESGKYLEMKPSLEEKYTALDINLSGLKTQPTQMFREPTLPRKEIKPRPILYIVLGIILGLLFGIFSAFIHEVIVNARKVLVSEMNNE